MIKWCGWFDRTFKSDPPALLPVVSGPEYFAAVGAKSRNMLRKCGRAGYTFGEIDRNEHLDRIGQINRSKPVRSGGPMRTSYLEPPIPGSPPVQLCDRHGQAWVGMFVGERLDAYCHLVVVNELAIVNTILAHAEAMPDGVSNGLIAMIVSQLHRNVPHCRFLNYTTMTGPDGLVRFKRSVGFAAVEIERTP